MPETVDNQAARLLNLYFRMDSPRPYQVEVGAQHVYMRWSTDNTNPIFILRISTDVNPLTTTYQYDYTIDTWARREVAHYIYNFN